MSNSSRKDGYSPWGGLQHITPDPKGHPDKTNRDEKFSYNLSDHFDSEEEIQWDKTINEGLSSVRPFNRPQRAVKAVKAKLQAAEATCRTLKEELEREKKRHQEVEAKLRNQLEYYKLKEELEKEEAEWKEALGKRKRDEEEKELELSVKRVMLAEAKKRKDDMGRD
ncbi:hypothetical protein IAU59_007060 [Kwoniella sp. CBS 9459]